MKKILLLFLLFVFFIEAEAQIRVYRGSAQFITEQVLHEANGRFFPGYSLNFDDALYTVRGPMIMEGPSGSEFDLIYTLKDNKLYRGNAMYTSQIAYTFNNGKFYKGDSTFELDVLFNVRNNVIYAGSQSFPTDAIFYIEGQPRLVDLFAILLSLELIS
jgi:hypothetical protein